jgi:hypothetical protein
MNLLEASVADPSLDDNRASLEVWQTDAWPRGSIWFETQLFKGSRPSAAATTGEGTVRLLRVISKPRVMSALERCQASLAMLSSGDHRHDAADQFPSHTP